MPPPMAALSGAGIEAMILLRSGEIVRIRKIRPETKTIASACYQVKPMPKQTV